MCSHTNRSGILNIRETACCDFNDFQRLRELFFHHKTKVNDGSVQLFYERVRLKTFMSRWEEEKKRKFFDSRATQNSQHKFAT